jgi:hypothetical protein
MAMGGSGRSFGGSAGAMNRGSFNRGNFGASAGRTGMAPSANFAGNRSGYGGRSNFAAYRSGYNGRGRGYYGSGRGFGLGFATGALIGAAPYYYGGGYSYGSYDDGYDDYAYAAVPAYGGDRDDGYCAQRFQSYDPASGTYLGYDGLRHPCP